MLNALRLSDYYNLLNDIAPSNADEQTTFFDFAAPRLELPHRKQVADMIQVQCTHNGMHEIPNVKCQMHKCTNAKFTNAKCTNAKRSIPYTECQMPNEKNGSKRQC